MFKKRRARRVTKPRTFEQAVPAPAVVVRERGRLVIPEHFCSEGHPVEHISDRLWCQDCEEWIDQEI